MKQVKISGWISVVQFCQVSSRFSTVGQLYQVGSMFSFSWLVISGRFYVLLHLVSYIRQVLCSPSVGYLYQVGFRFSSVVQFCQLGSRFSFSCLAMSVMFQVLFSLVLSGRFQVLFSCLVMSGRFQVLFSYYVLSGRLYVLLQMFRSVRFQVLFSCFKIFNNIYFTISIKLLIFLLTFELNLN